MNSYKQPRRILLAIVAVVALALGMGMAPWTHSGSDGTAVEASQPVSGPSSAVAYFPSQYTNAATAIEEHIEAF